MNRAAVLPVKRALGAGGRLAAAIGACVFGGGQPAEAKSPPPPVDSALAAFAKLPVCSPENVVLAREPAPEEKLRQQGYAIFTGACFPALPPAVLREMKSRHVSSVCGILFDVDQAGAPTLVGARCNIESVGKAPLDDEWRSYFDTVLHVAIKRASGTVTFEPAPDYEEREVREGFVQFYRYSDKKQLPPMKRLHKADLQ